MVLGQHLLQPVSRALAPTGNHHLLAVLAAIGGMIDHRLEDVDARRPLCCETAARLARKINDPGSRIFRREEWRNYRCLQGRQSFTHLIGRHVKRIRRHRLVGRSGIKGRIDGVLARLMVIANLLEPLAHCVCGMVVDCNVEPGHIVECCIEFLEEQRQPVFGSGKFPAFTDSLVQRVVAGCCPKHRDIAGAETTDGRLIKRQFAHRRQGQFLQLPGGAL